MLIKVDDKMQSGYAYECEAEPGCDFMEDFCPELTPKEMLKLGVFEGHYMTDCQKEFPKDWFAEARFSYDKPDVACNYFQVKSRQPLSVWRQKGWIYYPDPRGWFQWYCRYYMGRRIPEIDAIQIKRWKSFRRHKAQILKNCMLLDIECRKRQRQALLQWAYDPFF